MMGYVPPSTPIRPPSTPIRLNIDAHGLPKDYATYVWLMYGRVVEDRSPARRAFLYGPSDGPRLPDPDPMLMGYEYK